MASPRAAPATRDHAHDLVPNPDPATPRWRGRKQLPTILSPSLPSWWSKLPFLICSRSP